MSQPLSLGGDPISFRRRALLKAAACVPAIAPALATAGSVEVALAGLAFAGDAASLDRRFPYSRAYEAALKASGRSAYARMQDAVSASPPTQFRIVPQIDELKGRDQVIVVALVIGSETVSVEQFSGLHKVFVLIRAQALFFDFKSMAVVRAYPISFASIDTLDHPPGADEVRARVRSVYEGAAGKPGIFARFGNTLANARLPSQTSRSLQVTQIGIKPEAMGNIPAYLSSNATVAETWGADLVGEALSTRAGVPIIPFAKGYAVGNVMSLRISDGDVYNLTLPKPDYAISVELSALRKIEYGKASSGTSFIYGTYASLKIEEPLSGKIYLNTALKNGEVKLVPVTQTYVDDFPAFYDSVNGLFVKLSETIAGNNSDWIKTASAAPDMNRQIADTRELINQCR